MTSLLAVIGFKMACHSEPVEESCAEALAHMLRQAQQDSPFFKRHFTSELREISQFMMKN
jgi:phenylacetate-coenzyme A ligase PaaK-like adenylate-forming protein